MRIVWLVESSSRLRSIVAEVFRQQFLCKKAPCVLEIHSWQAYTPVAFVQCSTSEGIRLTRLDHRHQCKYLGLTVFRKQVTNLLSWNRIRKRRKFQHADNN